MQKLEYVDRLRRIIYTCGVNQRYHHRLEWRWGAADKSIRIIVGVLAIAGAILAVPPLDCAWSGFWVAIASVVAAAVLNIVPVGDREKFHGQMFRSWGELRKDALVDEQKTCDSEEAPEAHYLERLHELADKMECLHLEEPAPWTGLLIRCQEDENELEWGPGIRTSAQVEGERARRVQDQANTSTSAEAVASVEDRG